MDPAVQRQTISLQAALLVVETGLREAAAAGVEASVAVVGEAGDLRAFARTDDAPIATVQLAIDKAYSAAACRLATDAWAPALAADPSLAAGLAAGVDRLVVFGGGVPLSLGGRVIGGVGVSGGSSEQDAQLAQMVAHELGELAR
jgi:uncharacterized protein GlcG (DUF336 family)